MRALLVLACLASVASAEPVVGVLVSGQSPLHGDLQSQLGSWLRAHGNAANDAPLDDDGVKTLENCLLAQDHACARGVVEARAQADSLVFAFLEPTKTSTINITVYWLLKGREVTALRRACEDCNTAALAGVVDATMTTLASTTARDVGRLTINSKPAGTSVLIDHVLVGTTPITRDVTAGSHVVDLMKGNRKAGSRSIAIHAGEEVEITVPVHVVYDAPPSHVPATVLLAVGGGALAIGIALYATSETDDGARLYYRDTRAPGIAVAAGGLAIAAVGGILWWRAARAESAPSIALVPHGGIVGWSRAF